MPSGTIPQLTRIALHRCLQRHGISRSRNAQGEVSTKRKLKADPIGCSHIHIAEVRTAEGKLYMLVAIDCMSKFAFVELHEKATTRVAADFLFASIKAVPYKIPTVLPDDGTHFTDAVGQRLGRRQKSSKCWRRRTHSPFRAHALEFACAADIDHRLTKPQNPWTKGQAERMNRTIKDATVKRYFYETHAELRTHLADFVTAYNFDRRLKTLNGLTPHEFICKPWTKEPDRLNEAAIAAGTSSSRDLPPV